MTDEKTINFVKKEAARQLDAFDRPTKATKAWKPTRIRYKGEFLTLPSKKTLWRKPGDAKSALVNSMETGELVSYNYDTRSYDRKDGKRKDMNNAEVRELEELLKQEMLALVEFVPV